MLPLSSFERKKKKKTTTLCDNSGLCVIPESPTTAEALWKCDESTLKEVIGMFFFGLTEPVNAVRGTVNDPNSSSDGHAANKSIRVRPVCHSVCGLQVLSGS